MNAIEEGCWNYRFNDWTGRTLAPSHIVCPDDPGIVTSDNFADAYLIFEPEIRLVHLRQQAPEASRQLAAVDDPDFYKNMSGYLKGSRSPETLPQKHKSVWDSVAGYHHRMMEFSRELLGAGVQCGLRSSFNGVSNTPTGNRWHTDPEAVVISSSIEGSGTEYLVGPVSAEEARDLRTAFSQQIPSGKKAIAAAPGDILIMKGRGGASGDEASTKAIFHRSFPASRRTVLLYGM